jgi:hypothetical protein
MSPGSRIVEMANAQTEGNYQSSAQLAKSLNRFTFWLVVGTFCLVIVGIIQILVNVSTVFHH